MIQRYTTAPPPDFGWGCCLQTVDKTNAFRQFAKSFGRAFSKAREVEGAEPSSKYAKHTGSCLQLQCPAGVEKILGVFFLCIACNAAKRSVALASFLLRLSCQKKKRLSLLCNLITYTPFVYTLRHPPPDFGWGCCLSYHSSPKSQLTDTFRMRDSSRNS